MIRMIFSGYRDDVTIDVDFEPGTTGEEVIRYAAEMAKMDPDEFAHENILVADSRLLKKNTQLPKDTKVIRVLPHSFAG